jgi:hypothetical protein
VALVARPFVMEDVRPAAVAAVDIMVAEAVAAADIMAEAVVVAPEDRHLSNRVL